MPAAGGYYFLAHVMGWAFSKFIPDRQIRIAVIGHQSVGKTTLHSSMVNRFAPVYHDRVPTTAPQQPNMLHLYLDGAPNFFRDYRHTNWIKRDYPHDPSMVADQIKFLWPEIIFWVLDVDTWQHEGNLQVCKALAHVLQSSEYQRATKQRVTVTLPMVGRKGVVKKHLIKGQKRCKYIVMCLNKIDKKMDLSPNQRAQFCQGVLDWYMDKSAFRYLCDPNTPGQLLYIATSFQNGNYIGGNQLMNPPIPLQTYFEYLVTQVATKS